jgi:hypothetical protein
MEVKPKPKGGRRPGAGRPPNTDEKRMSIILNPLQRRSLREITGEVVLQKAVQKYINMHL